MQIDVSYVVEEKYPAPQTQEGLARALRDSRYQCLDHDFLHPDKKLEAPRARRSYVDGTSRPETCVRDLRYSVRDDSPCKGVPVVRLEPTTAKLKVTAGVIPATTARAMRGVRPSR